MTSYRYTAIDKTGHLTRGYGTSDSEEALAASLQQQGLELLTVKLGEPLRWRQSRVHPKMLIVFCVQLEQLLQAGLPLCQAIAVSAEQAEQAVMAEALRGLLRDLEAGKLLSQALQAQPKVFPALFYQLVNAGERTGQLPETFGQLKATLTWQFELSAQIKRGLSYPAVLCVMVMIAAYVMLTFLVPQMAGFLQSLGQALPWSTRCLLALSEGVMHYGAYLLLAILLSLGSVTLIVRRSEKWAYKWDSLMLRLPVFGRLLRAWVITRLCRFLGLMYQAGIPLLQALQWCQPLLTQRVMARALEDVSARVQAGESLTASFAATGQFPPLMLHLLKVGETTGGLDRMLFQLADYYDRDVQARIQSLLRMLEPALTISLGLMLLFLMAAVMLPVYDSFSTIRY
ncbi:type II secretion system F family protein [Methylophilus sp. YYY-1]|uniref:type II secretion system F family protein n=1 Tax=Methylophilus sp. YYY-1 TaxID=2682087 RepID=UPI0023B34705|nr:type II secretion system F family protein [Methylophilus sp. YYY-1]MDF0379356.1 type II secretion system F family protein [Methylophilus sp. YYY-1]